MTFETDESVLCIEVSSIQECSYKEVPLYTYIHLSHSQEHMMSVGMEAPVILTAVQRHIYVAVQLDSQGTTVKLVSLQYVLWNYVQYV